MTMISTDEAHDNEEEMYRFEEPYDYSLSEDVEDIEHEMQKANGRERLENPKVYQGIASARQVGCQVVIFSSCDRHGDGLWDR